MMLSVVEQQYKKSRPQKTHKYNVFAIVTTSIDLSKSLFLWCILLFTKRLGQDLGNLIVTSRSRLFLDP